MDHLISQILGHPNLSTTFIYAKASLKIKAAEMANVDDLLTVQPEEVDMVTIWKHPSWPDPGCNTRPAGG